MPNIVEFIVPVAPALALDFSKKPSDFRLQFAPMAPANAPLPSPLLNQAQLIADALDSGYGSNIGPMPSLSASDRAALQAHLRAQLDLTLTLLTQSPPPNPEWILQPFASIIEKTAKSADSFLLGMLYARVATRLWGQARGLGNIQEFWHYGVLTKEASHFMAGIAYEEENPDFLVKFDTGVWACVEAKGSFSDVDNGDLKKGLHQAGKLAAVRWLHAGASSPTTVFPTEQACAMTYFAPPGDTLQVMLMDPPAARVEGTQKEIKVPLLFKEGGDFVRWAQAAEQFEGITAARIDNALLMEGPFEGRYIWARFPGQEHMWVGIPTILYETTPQLNAALVILEWLVPYLTRWRQRPSQTIRGVNRRLLNMERYAKARARDADVQARDEVAADVNTSEPRLLAIMWKGLERFLSKYRSDNQKVIEWTDVLRGIWSCDLFAHQSREAQVQRHLSGTFEWMWDNLSINELVERRFWHHRINLGNEANLGASLARTTHGLVVAKADKDSIEKVRDAVQTAQRTRGGRLNGMS
ncbi:hypothetical protein B0G62_10777 [Paraburkholderia eburnea]|uniref:Uncharacterized protein n=1 Tax=Paraburkholderia eburnea TaxID=1189126 RepID=A0A2S4M8Q7_9BURK|nr:hypothetical protein [Paraburkholderia eburnea]POR51051.1 hypothetical protein B0G62_10777 [Paraburkholderia eburnea]PRZ21786.1 hypothetical protein BX588_10877 [Paraburkholderia eburnea]